MKKPNLELISKELHPTQCYEGLIEIDKLLKLLSEVNSNFTMNKTELIKKISIVFYGEDSKTFSKNSKFDQHFNGLNHILARKNELLKLLRQQLDRIEKEAIIQEETVGSLNQEVDSLSNPTNS